MMIGDTPAEFSTGIATLFKDAALHARGAPIERRCINIVNYFSAAVRRTTNKLAAVLDTTVPRGYGKIERWVRLRVDLLAQTPC